MAETTDVIEENGSGKAQLQQNEVDQNKDPTAHSTGLKKVLADEEGSEAPKNTTSRQEGSSVSQIRQSEWFHLAPPLVDLSTPKVRQYVQAFLRLLLEGQLSISEARQYMDAFVPTDYCDQQETRLWEIDPIREYFEFWGLHYHDGSFAFTPRATEIRDLWPKSIQSQLNKIDYRLRNNPLQTLGMKWNSAGVLKWNPIAVTDERRAYTARLRAVRVGTSGPTNHWETPGGAVDLLEVRPFAWGTVAALKIQNRGGSDHRINTSWVKYSSPEESKIRLRDLESGRIFWPIDATFGDVIIQGRPEVRLVAFAPLDQPTSKICIEARNIKVSKGTGRQDAFQLKVEGSEVWRGSQVALRDAPMTAELEHLLRKQLGGR